jgi:hypothetical protein
MKETNINYILFFFGKHVNNQEKLVKNIAEDLIVISDSKDIKYYFGSESAIFTFKSGENFIMLDEYMKIIFDEMECNYFLLPYNPDNMSVGLSNETSKHLFSDNNDENMSENGFEAQQMLSKELKDKFSFFFNKTDEEYDFNDDDDDTELLKIKKKPQTPTIDDILDKINDEGIRSLTKEELYLLENYSK